MKAVAIDSNTDHAVRAFLTRLAGRFDVAEAILFGSRARHQHREDSDADLAVILHGPKGPFLDTKLAMADLAYDVLLETGVLIQPLPIWEGEWEQPETFISPDLLRNIRREGIRL
ncbi:nucleotidyltransferase domain-containing protein [Thioalkalivibrio paradoxus]|uniref:DNA polymerase III subunit beta n=1 Tax=Thioalkalivibrio paradoxus ARh 1 TaxID=713585 RepID=W0DKS7_9GAMM|nr:nucleotidyltransferase domain-containing protein [Thioalkalivibrio paradoxus]AHE99169.1 DNA polymerase III subunit beta [Thioalkalivibrio paradoxus ARh 1]